MMILPLFIPVERSKQVFSEHPTTFSVNVNDPSEHSLKTTILLYLVVAAVLCVLEAGR